MASYSSLASNHNSTIVNRVRPSELVVNIHRPLCWQHLWYDAKVVQERTSLLSKWQYSQIISTVSAGSTATIVLAATTSFCRLRPTYSVLQIRRSVRQSRMLLLLLLPEPNLLAALEIAQPSFPLLWPSPSETTVVLMKTICFTACSRRAKHSDSLCRAV